jgi:hypothetical protein
VTYLPPAVEHQEPIDEAFVLGVAYFTPTWTEQPDQRDQDR